MGLKSYSCGKNKILNNYLFIEIHCKKEYRQNLNLNNLSYRYELAPFYENKVDNQIECFCLTKKENEKNYKYENEKFNEEKFVREMFLVHKENIIIIIKEINEDVEKSWRKYSYSEGNICKEEAEHQRDYEIDMFCKNLANIWKEKCPDWRFSQFMVNTLNSLEVDPFFYKDKEMLEYLTNFFGSKEDNPDAIEDESMEYFENKNEVEKYFDKLLSKIGKIKIKRIFTLEETNYIIKDEKIIYNTDDKIYMMLDSNECIVISYLNVSLIGIQYRKLNAIELEKYKKIKIKDLFNAEHKIYDIVTGNISYIDLVNFKYSDIKHIKVNGLTHEFKTWRNNEEVILKSGGNYFNRIDFCFSNGNKISMCPQDFVFDGYLEFWIEELNK